MGDELSATEKRLLAADDRKLASTGKWLAVIFGFIGASVIIVLVQSIIWLKSGVWPSFTMREGFGWLGVPVPAVSWKGAQQIIQYAISCPVAGASFAIGIALIFVFTRNDRRPVPDELRTARQKRSQRLSRTPS
ncbi:MAG: hypothetical protein M3Y22_07030 [Pseudomonadota bacterium]|nr:hypothetical protein [Pseudomonadota bacterium]